MGHIGRISKLAKLGLGLGLSNTFENMEVYPNFTMTAGLIGGLWNGYQPPVGSINEEPFPGFPLAFMASNGSNGDMSFTGNILSTVSGTEVFINGTKQNGAWSFGSGVTSFIFSAPRPTFVAGNTYYVELR